MTLPALPPTRHLLLIEDSEADALMAQLNFDASPVGCCLHIVHDGVEALDFLRREADFGEAPRPHLILLDMHLPRLNGYELLGELRGDPALAGIPVLVMLGSPLDQHGMERQGVRASGFVVKPVDFAGLAPWMER